MHATTLPDAAAAPIVLPAVLDLAQADALHAAMLAGLENEAPGLSLDGSFVAVVSTACLQVLTAAAVASSRRDRGFALVAASPALSGAARDLGLSGLLGLEAS